MKSRNLLRGLAVALAMVAVGACQGTDEGAPEFKDGSDIQAYLEALPHARVVDVDEKSGVPSFVTGRLGTLPVVADDLEATEFQAMLEAIAPALRANAAELVLRSASTDNIGDQHFRFRQKKNGLDVIHGEIVVHVRDGEVYAVNGRARADLPAATEAAIDLRDALAAARDNASELADAAVAEQAPLAYLHGDDRLDLVYQVEVTGSQADGTPVRDTVLVNALDGSIALRMPHIHTAKNRALYSANNGTTLPGTLKRSEGGAANADSIVNTNYDRLGTVYDCYFNLFGRDSYNAAGAQMKSTVHYSTNYVNAFWNGTQMVYGDGDNVNSTNLAISMDVTAHELTHAVTENESNLTYSGESGGLNEAMSDIFGNVCELYSDCGGNLNCAPTSNTWKVGEDIWTPPTYDDDALRYMNDPALDGASLDFWTSSAGNVDVHYSSGIANLAFKLLVTGGTHPRGKSSVNVTGIGMNKAAQIFYRANRDLLTAGSNFAAAKTATEQAASQLGYTAAEIASVTAAWNAVGVGVAAPPPQVTPLTNGVAVTNISGAAGSQKYYSLVVPAGQTTLTFATSGGTGDVDLYVNPGAVPTTSTYTCRPYASGNAETCTFNSPAAATYYVMLNAYSAYSGVTLTGTYSASGGGNVLTDGVAKTGLSGAAGAALNYTMTVPAGKSTLSFTMSGGTGDADLYVRFGSAPTTTTYNCRPYLSGNNETCTFSNPSGGTWYVMVRGYSAFSGVSLVGDYP